MNSAAQTPGGSRARRTADLLTIYSLSKEPRLRLPYAHHARVPGGTPKARRSQFDTISYRITFRQGKSAAVPLEPRPIELAVQRHGDGRGRAQQKHRDLAVHDGGADIQRPDQRRHGQDQGDVADVGADD